MYLLYLRSYLFPKKNKIFHCYLYQVYIGNHQSMLPGMVELLINGYGDKSKGWETSLFSH